jgi:zinc protease
VIKIKHDVTATLEIPYTHRRLDNGLHVLIHEDRGCPIVAVNIWYHVGSKNEQPGRTGFAHLFEHLMFEGSQHYDRGYFQPLQEAGGSLNGSTNTDRTNYWEVMPSNALELALWMESDRMGYLLPALTPAKFDNQRDVVLNERRQNYENRPYGLAGMSLVAALYPPDHPYHWLTIGQPEDLRAARLEDVQSFFRTYYRPGNASLALAGDVDAEAAFALVADYFGDIEEGDDPPEVAWEPAELGSEIRLVLHDRIELPRLYLAWHSPKLFGEGDAELDLVADLLAGGKTSRLYRKLVYETKLATEVASSQNSREIGSFFQIVATAAPDCTLEELDAVIMQEVAALTECLPSDGEMERCLAQAEAHFISRLQTVGGFGGKSDQLNAYNVFLGNPGYFEQDLMRYRAATGASLQRAAARWLAPAARVALSVVPHGRAALALAHSQPVKVS